MSDDDIKVGEGAHRRHVIIVCGSAAFDRLKSRLIDGIQMPEGIDADRIQFIELHDGRSREFPAPAENDWRGRAALIGCVGGALVAAAVFIVGIFAVIDWFRK